MLQVELEVAINTEKNYSTLKGEDIGRAVNEANAQKGNNVDFYSRYWCYGLKVHLQQSYTSILLYKLLKLLVHNITI